MDKVTDKVEEVAVVYPQLIRDELIRFFKCFNVRIVVRSDVVWG